MSAARRTTSPAIETNLEQLNADAKDAAIGVEKLAELMTRDARGGLDPNGRAQMKNLMARLADALPELQKAYGAIEEAKRLRELPN